MNQFESFIRKIPGERLLICGSAGEYWTDAARFSSHNPSILPSVFEIEDLSRRLDEIEEGYFKGIFIAWGVSRLIFHRNILEKLTARLEDNGVFLTVEGNESGANPGGRQHLKYLRLLYDCEILPLSRIIEVLKSYGLSHFRTVELFDTAAVYGENSLSTFKNSVRNYLLKANTDECKALLREIDSEGIEPAGMILIQARKRISKSAGSFAGLKSSMGLKRWNAVKQKLLERGMEDFTNAELLSIVLGCDVEMADKLYEQYGSKGLLKERDSDKLISVLSGDDETAAHLQAVLEICRRLTAGDHGSDLYIHSPQEAYSYLQDMRYLRKEQLRGLYFSLQGKLIGDEVIALGSFSKTMATPREIIAPAIEKNAGGIIIAHNHISGVKHPSDDDIEMTIKIEKAAEMMDIGFWDHIIITDSGYYSFSETGRLKAKWSNG